MTPDLQHAPSSPEAAPLEDPLTGSPFHVRAALLAGVSPARLGARDLAAPFAGIRVPAGIDLSDLRNRCRALLPRLRENEFFSHVTALRLWGAPVLGPSEPALDTDAGGDRGPETLHLSVLSPERAVRLRGAWGHQLQGRHLRILDLDGLPVCDPISAWTLSATTLPVRELVVAGDWLCLPPKQREENAPGTVAAAEESVVTPVDFADRVNYARARGNRRGRAAAALVRVGAESRMESLLRLLLRAHGLGEPELQFVVNTRSGDFVGRFDLAYPDERLLIEYDGEQHRLDRAQYVRDIRRLDRARAAGYRVVRVLAEDLLDHPTALVERIKNPSAS